MMPSANSAIIKSSEWGCAKKKQLIKIKIQLFSGWKTSKGTKTALRYGWKHVAEENEFIDLFAIDKSTTKIFAINFIQHSAEIHRPPTIPPSFHSFSHVTASPLPPSSSPRHRHAAEVDLDFFFLFFCIAASIWFLSICWSLRGAENKLGTAYLVIENSPYAFSRPLYAVAKALGWGTPPLNWKIYDTTKAGAQ